MAVSLWATGRGLGAWVSARRRLERKLWDHRRLARRWVGPLESWRGDLEEPGVLELWLCPNGVRYGAESWPSSQGRRVRTLAAWDSSRQLRRLGRHFCHWPHS